jgi:hypothetical protein
MIRKHNKTAQQQTNQINNSGLKPQSLDNHKYFKLYFTTQNNRSNNQFHKKSNQFHKKGY